MAQKISNSDIKQMAYAVAAQLIIDTLGGQAADNLASEIVGSNFAAAFNVETDIDDADLEDATDKVIGKLREVAAEINDRAESFGGFF